MDSKIEPVVATEKDRAAAKAAAAGLRAAFANSAAMGERLLIHVDFARPRRGDWWETWSNLPGFTRINGQRFTHRLLPGWEYSRSEIKSELIPDLDALAEHGVRPTEATR